MRIQWSGDVAQEMLGKLQVANRGMQECLRRAAAARLTEPLQVTGRQQMAGADPDGQNRAMQAATERFERCSGRLQLLATQLEDFQRALRRADDLFAEAEAQAIHLAEQIEPPPSPPERQGAAPVRWGIEALGFITERHSGAPPLPEWLEALLR